MAVDHLASTSAMSSSLPSESPCQEPTKRRRKVKTGCRTCKIRRVKCDEGRPACHRCVSTGRVCDGYGIWGGGGNRYEQRIGAPVCTRKPISNVNSIKLLIKKVPAFGPVKAASAEEREFFEWFKCRTSTKLPGAFGTSFWSSVVFQASSSEPAVLHAVLALSSAHKRKELDSIGRDRSRVPPDKQEAFMLRQYSTAIGYLQPNLLPSGKGSVRVALITCLVFIFLEFVRGRYQAGCVHLENGLRLIKDLEPASRSNGSLLAKGTTRSAGIDSLDTSLTELFTRLQVQAAMFGQHVRQYDPTPTLLETALPTLKFGSANEARNHLDMIFNGISHITEEYDRISESGSYAEGLQALLCNDQAFIHASLNAWLRTYEATVPDANFRKCSLEGFAYQLLRVYYTMASIMTATCRSLQCQVVFDLHTPKFLSIIDHSIQISKAVSSPEIQASWGSHPEMSASTSDIGWIPPLYYTALKCRNHCIRVQAVQMLQSRSHKEGIWDSKLASSVANEVIRIEEGDVYGEARDTFPLDELPGDDHLKTPMLPETRRMQKVDVVLPKNDTDRIELVCKRRNDGEWKVIHKAYDDSTGCWVHVPLKKKG